MRNDLLMRIRDKRGRRLCEGEGWRRTWRCEGGKETGRDTCRVRKADNETP